MAIGKDENFGPTVLTEKMYTVKKKSKQTITHSRKI